MPVESKVKVTSTLPVVSLFFGREDGLCGDGLAVHLKGLLVTLPSSSVTFTWRLPFKV